MAANANIYESQATWSISLAAVAALAVLGVAVLVLQRFDLEDFSVVMRAGGARFYAILGGIFLAGAASFVGSLLGFSSAGHKRNKKSGMSWAGFFLNAVLVAVTLCLFAFFWLTKDTVTLPGQ